MPRRGQTISYTINATGTYSLGIAVEGRVCSWLVQFTDASFTGTGVTPVGRAAGSADSIANQNLAYKDMTTGANATAAITGDATILIDGSGLWVSLSATVSSGSLGVVAVPLLG